MRALLVEDDTSSALLSRSVMESDGFAVDVAITAQDGLTCAMVTDYDVIVLDLGLPDGNGISIVQALRRSALARHTHGLLGPQQFGKQETLRDAGDLVARRHWRHAAGESLGIGRVNL